MKPRGHSTLAKFPCFTFFLFIWKLPSLSGKKDWHSQCLSPMPSQHTFPGQSLGPAPWSAGAPGRCPETCSEDPTPVHLWKPDPSAARIPPLCIYGNQTPFAWSSSQPRGLQLSRYPHHHPFTALTQNQSTGPFPSFWSYFIPQGDV